MKAEHLSGLGARWSRLLWACAPRACHVQPHTCHAFEDFWLTGCIASPARLHCQGRDDKTYRLAESGGLYEPQLFGPCFHCLLALSFRKHFSRSPDGHALY